MKYHYASYLKPLAKNLRKAGNLAEVLLWHEIKQDKLGYRFLRQRPIDRYIVDFYCYKLSLVIEVDGSSHDDKIEYDAVRQKTLESLGMTVIRFRDTDVKYNLEGVVENIKDTILRLASESPPLGKEE